jgi:cytochrome b involved in lipid metabolism/fatty acid desaturase
VQWSSEEDCDIINHPPAYYVLKIICSEYLNIMIHPSYDHKEVAQHSSSSSCWVIIDGAVLDVTEFIHRHPGGASALNKQGRAGTDVTSFFELVGHSGRARAMLQDLQVGVLRDSDGDTGINEHVPLLTTSLGHTDGSGNDPNGDDREYAAGWHAQRRRDILRDHPNIETLFGSNPFTCGLGLITVIIHCCTCLVAQRLWWVHGVLLAATVGAVCKMYQFAVNHDVCHGTAGEWLNRSDLLKRCAMQVLTLPSLGGTMHTYYEFQHLGHHASLGAQSLEEAQGKVVDFSAPAASAVARERGVQAEVACKAEEGQGKEEGRPRFTMQSVRGLLFFPDGDGDMLALGTLSLGHVLESWGSVSGAMASRRYLAEDLLSTFHNWKYLKVLLVQLGHLQHHGMMSLLFLQLLLLPPFISFPLFLCPDFVARSILQLTRASFDATSIVADLGVDVEDLACKMMCRIISSVGVHAYLWVGLDWWLLFGPYSAPFSLGACVKGIVYLYLSELFLYGFLCHPFMGYFLGVHRSRGLGFTSPVTAASSHVSATDAATAHRVQMGSAGTRRDAGCQPTMSTYSFWAAVCSMNLTHHVEHHDFPQIPWNRLPQVTRLAPEYYETLEQSPGFCATIYRWIEHSEGWSYACQ